VGKKYRRGWPPIGARKKAMGKRGKGMRSRENKESPHSVEEGGW